MAIRSLQLMSCQIRQITEVNRHRDSLQFNLLMRNLNRRKTCYEQSTQKPCQCSIRNAVSWIRTLYSSFLHNYESIINKGLMICVDKSFANLVGIGQLRRHTTARQTKGPRLGAGGMRGGHEDPAKMINALKGTRSWISQSESGRRPRNG